MVSPTQWTWVWANSSRWWRTTYSKSTKVINLRYMFFVISGHLLSRCTFDHMDFLTTMTHTYTGSSPVSLEQFLRPTERLSPELQSLVRPWIKHNSHLLRCVCVFFFWLTTPFKRCSNKLKPTFEDSDDCSPHKSLSFEQNSFATPLAFNHYPRAVFSKPHISQLLVSLEHLFCPSCPEETGLTPTHGILKPLK